MTLKLLASGPLAALAPEILQKLRQRTTSRDPQVRTMTAEIVERVRSSGDSALRDLAWQFDGARLTDLEIPMSRCEAALANLDPALRTAMERSARNIAAFHQALLPHGSEVEVEPGILVGRRPDPLRVVGVYAPGGRAVYPSSVLMGAIPARVAGVAEVIVCSPPGADGRPADVLLAAAALAEADRVFAVGGAGAIAAMAFGTATIPRVDRIVGPGNAYVAEAKLQVVGDVGIDAPAGPSELLIIADRACNPDRVVLEAIAQAEHDPNACVVILAVGEELGRQLQERLASGAERSARREVVLAALAGQGALLTCLSEVEAVDFANAYAAEHVLLAVANPERTLAALRSAGTVFTGDWNSVAFGDYMTGANHVLPTGGLSRCYSGLSTADFFRWTTYQRVEQGASRSLAPDVASFASAEGLPGHAAAAAYAGGLR